jgi:hypothetical protein
MGKSIRTELAKPSDDSGTLVAVLPGGSTVELLALSDSDAKNSPWWRPDGTIITNSSFSVEGPAGILARSALQRFLAFRVVSFPLGNTTPVYDLIPTANVSDGGIVLEGGNVISGGWPMRIAWPSPIEKATLRLGYSFDPWRTVLTDRPGHSSITNSVKAGDPKWTAILNHVNDDGTDTHLTMVLDYDQKNWNMRTIAVDRAGGEHPHTRATGTPTKDTTTWTYTFSDLTMDDLAEFRVQIRPIHWAEFRDVALYPQGEMPRTVGSSAQQAPDQIATENDTTGELAADLPDGRNVR